MFARLLNPQAKWPRLRSRAVQSLMLVSLFAGLAGCAPTPEVSLRQPRERMRVATTTSLYDTGLWVHLEPMFEERYGLELDITMPEPG